MQKPKDNDPKVKKQTKKKAPAVKREPSPFSQDKEKNREPEQSPEQYAIDTISEKCKQGAQTVKKAVRKLTEQKEEPSLTHTASEYYRKPSAPYPDTGKALKSRESPEQVHHTVSHDIKAVDSGVKDKSVVQKKQETSPSPNPATQTTIRQKQAESFQQRTQKYREEYTDHLPASDISEAGFSLPQTDAAEQARQTTVQKFKIKRRMPRKKKKQDTGNQAAGSSDSITPRGKLNSSGNTGNPPYQQHKPYRDTGYGETPVLMEHEQSPQNTPSRTEPGADSKKLKTVDRKTGTVKTRGNAELKHHSGSFKIEAAKGIKTTGNAGNSAVQGTKSTQLTQTTNSMGQAGASTTGHSAAGAASGGVMVAVQIVKKGKEKLQEIAQKNTTESSGAEGSTQTLGCFGVTACVLFIPCFLIFFLLFGGNSFSSSSNKNLSAEVLAYMPLIQETCQKYEIPEYAYIIAAIMMQESGGRAEAVNGDVMQAAESRGWPAGIPIEPSLSIDYGVQHFKSCLILAGMPPPSDLDGISLPIQGYNFGTGYITWAFNKYGGYTKENAREFSNIWASRLGWSSYGDVSYVEHVLRYYEPGGGTGGVGDIGLIGDGLIAYPMPGYTWTTYSGHSGIDISGDVNGKPVVAAASGVVSHARNGWLPSDGTSGMASYGNVVYIDHEGTPYQTRYAHLSYCIVSVGDYVQQGQVIGYVGSTGNSSGPHLHFEIVVNGSRWHADGRCYAEYAFPQYKR